MLAHRVTGEEIMKTIAVLLCSFLVLSMGVVLPDPCGAESVAAQREETERLFEQIRDLDMMQRNIEACYQAERKYNETGVASRAGRIDAELDARLMHRVFGRLAGHPEFDRFVAAHHSLMQLPEFRQRHADELFTEYVRLLEAARIRLLSRIKAPEESPAGDIALASGKGLKRFKTVDKVLAGQDDDTGLAGRGKVVPAVLVSVEEAPLNRMLLDTGPACITRTIALRPESGSMSINLPGTGRSIPSN
jgi:hypothetical protein